MENKFNELKTRAVEEIIGETDLDKLLKSGKKLRIKHGIDPTSTDIHLGYTVIYHKLKEFQELGHKVVFLIGDFTARFGDPTDKLKTRKMRDKKEVMQISKKYLEQIGKILDLKKTEIRYNGEWYDKMSAEELLHLMSRFTLDRMLERDMFVERKKREEEIGLHEPTYPVLQGYDSVMLKSDLAVCGTDQTFNELQGRKLQKEFGQNPQVVMIMPVLIGLDGTNKMGQSLGNYIGVNEPADIQYGKIMSIPDKLILQYYELAARTGGRELAQIKEQYKNINNRRNLKAALARDIVSIYNGAEASVLAEENFNRVFRNKDLPLNIQEVEIKKGHNRFLSQLLLDLKLVNSKNEAKRLITQGGVKIDKVKITDPYASISLYNGMVIQAGKLKFAKIRLN